MNTGIISSRYAKALLAFAEKNGEADRVCREAIALDKALAGIYDIRQIAEDRIAVSLEDKIAMFAAVLEEEGLSMTMRKFLETVICNDRVECLRLMMHSFVDKYSSSRNTCFARLVTAVPAPGLSERLREIVRSSTGHDVIIEASVDSSIIGGFLFKINDLRVDATIARQISTLKKQFRDKNRRIV